MSFKNFSFLVILLSILSFSFISYSSKGANLKSKPKKSGSLLKLYFVDTERGEAIFVSYKGHNMLIDAGPMIAASSLHGRNRQKKVEGLIPFFNRLKIKKLDFVVISYVDRYHIGNLPIILEEMNVFNVIDGAYANSFAIYAKSLEIIEDKKINYLLARAGSTFTLGNDVGFRVIYPSRGYGVFSKDYDKSLVLKMSFKNFSVLFTGAIGKDGISKLIKLSSGAKSTFLKMPYNYRGDDNIIKLLDSIGPEAVYIPPGKHAIYKKLIGYSTEKGISVYSAHSDGTVLVETDGDKYWVKDYK